MEINQLTDPAWMFIPRLVLVAAGSRQRSDWSDAGGYLQSSSWSLIERKLRNRNCPKLPPIKAYWPLDCLYQDFNWKLMLVQPIVRTVRLCCEVSLSCLPPCLQSAIEMSADWEVICIQCWDVTTDSSDWLWRAVRSWRSLILSSSRRSRSEDDQFWDQTRDWTEVRFVPPSSPSSPVCQEKNINLPVRSSQVCSLQMWSSLLQMDYYLLADSGWFDNWSWQTWLTPGQILSYTNYTESLLSFNVKNYTKLSQSNIATFHHDDLRSLL